MQGDLASTPFTFVGRSGYYRDLETELYYIRDNYDDPPTARWVRPDRKEHADALANGYRYVANNPINEVDPSGMQYTRQEGMRRFTGPKELVKGSKPGQQRLRPANQPSADSRAASPYGDVNLTAESLPRDEAKTDTTNIPRARVDGLIADGLATTVATKKGFYVHVVDAVGDHIQHFLLKRNESGSYSLVLTLPAVGEAAKELHKHALYTATPVVSASQAESVIAGIRLGNQAAELLAKY